MHYGLYTALVFLPSALFSIISLPVKRYNRTQEILLAILWLINLAFPVVQAGTCSLLVMMSTAVVAWATGLKMAVWLFCMPLEERRKRPFYGTLFYWREKSTRMQQKTKAAVGVSPPEALQLQQDQQQQQPRQRSSAAPSPSLEKTPVAIVPLPQHKHSLSTYIYAFLKHQLIVEILHFAIIAADNKQSINVFRHAVDAVFFRHLMSPPLTLYSITASFWLCMLFSIYLQIQLQTTYDLILIAHGVVSYALPWLNGPAQWMHVSREYIQGAANMPPAFDSPWEATSLRDYWSNRWHQFYNTCFTRLVYIPLRRVLLQSPVLRRTIPTWAVFGLSGIMHEYFLYCATGPQLYFAGGAGGWQFLFFMLQPIGILIGDMYFPTGLAGRCWAIGWMIGLSHLFVFPYLLCNYLDIVQLRITPLFVMLIVKFGSQNSERLVHRLLSKASTSSSA